MDDDGEVLDRLERIERLDAAGAPAAELLGEVRALLRAAERAARRADHEELDQAVARMHGAFDAGSATSADGGGGDHLAGWPVVTVLDRPA